MTEQGSRGESTTARTGRPLPPAPPHNHGRTPAAWTTMALLFLGVLVSAAGIVVSQSWMFWAGLGVGVVGLLVGALLRGLGYGQKESTR